MRHTICLAMVIMFSLVFAAGCRKPEEVAKEDLKKEIAENKGGGDVVAKNGSDPSKPTNNDPKVTEQEKAGGVKNKYGDAGAKNDVDPFKPKSPDPKIVEQKKAEEAKQSTLAQLCRDAFSPAKKPPRRPSRNLRRIIPTSKCRSEP